MPSHGLRSVAANSAPTSRQHVPRLVRFSGSYSYADAISPRDQRIEVGMCSGLSAVRAAPPFPGDFFRTLGRL